MNENNQFDGEFKEVSPEQEQQETKEQPTQEQLDQEETQEDVKPTAKRFKKPNSNLTKIFVVALVGGLLGGGIVTGGYALYQNRTVDGVTSNNSKGTTSTSTVNVSVNSQTSKAFNSIKGAVVSVEAYTTSQANSIEALLGGSDSQETTSISEGSGVIYKKTDNTAFIVTNNHVISGSDKVEVILNSGKKLSATVVGHDSITDLAVLKINASDVKQVATFGNSDNIKVGETALAIGSPLGSQYATSLTQGIISAKKRTVSVTNSAGVETGQATVIQTDAAINPGNSGGPLINLQGQVIGINSMKLASTGSDGTSVEGIGFAIPSNEVVNIINQLVTNGKVVRPALGISLIDLTNVPESEQESLLKLPSSVTSGIVVAKINDDSPLKNSGIEKYDVIVSLGGKEVSGIASLREALYSHKIGDSVEIKYYHDGKLKTTTVKLTLESNDSNTSAASNEGE